MLRIFSVAFFALYVTMFLIKQKSLFYMKFFGETEHDDYLCMIHPVYRKGEDYMSLIKVSNLTFCYEGSFDNIFDNVSFLVDTDWKLGFVGRNGKGKTTFLKILQGELEYEGAISKSVEFDYFPYTFDKDDKEITAIDLMDKWKPGVEFWRVMIELSELKQDSEILYRPFITLSHGERTKVMLSVLFSGDNDFLLIDEPTNHVDITGRDIIKDYLARKKGFILVSHDRDLLDECVDHVLVLNRSSIEVQTGNFSSWLENKEKTDAFKLAENEKHKKEIVKLKIAADRMSRRAIKNESTKIGFDPLKEPERCISTRSYIGAKTKKMQSRVKSVQNRIQKEIDEKEGLLADIESICELKINPLTHYKDTLIVCKDVSIGYSDSRVEVTSECSDSSVKASNEATSECSDSRGDGTNRDSGDKVDVISGISFKLNRGDRMFISGQNGCGKSSLIKAILKKLGKEEASAENIKISGEMYLASDLTVSYINQDTSRIKGKLKDYALNEGVDYTLLLTLLRKLDLNAVQFEKDISEFSEGQKKKVLIATSLITPAHIYIWDEPLNYIDVFSRMQLEKLIERYKPTMIIVEHDKYFGSKLATTELKMSDGTAKFISEVSTTEGL